MNRISRFALSVGLVAVLGAGCSTYVHVPVVAWSPPEFSQTMQGGRKVALVLIRPQEMDLSEFGDYVSTLYGSVKNAVHEYRYLVVVDTDSRKQRLEEIAFSRTGLTSEQLTIGKELAVDAFLFIEVPQAPKHSCTVSSTQEQKSECVRRNDKGECLETRQYTVTKFTATLTMSVFIQGRLVNVTTGRTMAHQATNIGADKAMGTDREGSWLSIFGRGAAGQFSVSSTGSPPSCPSVLTAFAESARVASFVLVKNLSPRVTDMKVILEEKLTGVSDAAEKRVKGYIKRGVRWASATPPNLDEAFRSWKEALDLSGGQSVAALWNMAVVYWTRGEYDEALAFFRKAEKIAGPDYMEGDRADVFSRFMKEKERVEQERSRSSFLGVFRRVAAFVASYFL